MYFKVLNLYIYGCIIGRIGYYLVQGLSVSLSRYVLVYVTVVILNLQIKIWNKNASN